MPICPKHNIEHKMLFLTTYCPKCDNPKEEIKENIDGHFVGYIAFARENYDKLLNGTFQYLGTSIILETKDKIASNNLPVRAFSKTFKSHKEIIDKLATMNSPGGFKIRICLEKHLEETRQSCPNEIIVFVEEGL